VSAGWDYSDEIALLREQDPALAGEFAEFTGIRSVLDWMQKRGLAKARIDIIGQDEFHYDFLIELETGGRWVSFGVT
jgi:hypothetical protein